MTPKEAVLTRYPQAVAVHQQPIPVLGQEAPIQVAGWVILSAPYIGAQPLGSGTEEPAAWDDAAASMRPKVGFKQWLAAQADRVDSTSHRRQVIEEWTSAVAALFAQLVKWLAEDDAHQLLAVETGTIEKNELGLGQYEIAAMRISLSSRFAELIPLGRQVVGGIGKRGDLGLRAEGRIDMRNQVQKYMLYRVASTEAKKWVIVDDEAYRVQDLTKESFEAALQDLLS